MIASEATAVMRTHETRSFKKGERQQVRGDSFNAFNRILRAAATQTGQLQREPRRLCQITRFVLATLARRASEGRHFMVFPRLRVGLVWVV